MREEAKPKTGKPTPSRNKPERPRDELGRPQPWGADNLLEMEDFDSNEGLYDALNEGLVVSEVSDAHSVIVQDG